MRYPWIYLRPKTTHDRHVIITTLNPYKNKHRLLLSGEKLALRLLPRLSPLSRLELQDLIGFSKILIITIRLQQFLSKTVQEKRC